MEDIERREFDALADQVRKAYEPRRLVLEQGGSAVEVALVPQGMKINSLKQFHDEYRAAPERKKGTAQLLTLDSLIEHVNRHKGDSSVLFANPNRKAPQIVAVYDYNEPGSGSPRFGDHRGVYPFPLSDEWQAWNAHNEKGFSQDEFAAWIEDKLKDVRDPSRAGESVHDWAESIGVELASPARLLTLAKGLSVHVGQKVTNRVNPATGEATLHFEAQHQDEHGGELKVPGAFALAIPVFRNGDLYAIGARLRYRVQGAALTWSYQLANIDAVFDDAFGGACEKAREATELPLFVGLPES